MGLQESNLPSETQLHRKELYILPLNKYWLSATVYPAWLENQHKFIVQRTIAQRNDSSSAKQMHQLGGATIKPHNLKFTGEGEEASFWTLPNHGSSDVVPDPVSQLRAFKKDAKMGIQEQYKHSLNQNG